jgi:hypothetical protein
VRIATRYSISPPEANILQTPPPVTSTTNENYIVNRFSITTTEEGLNRYIEITDETSMGMFCARIILGTNIDIHKYKKDIQFIHWLKSENMQLDRNPLQMTLRPQKVGFFTHMIPRSDQTSIYEHRVQLGMPDTCHQFFLQSSHIQIANMTTKVWKVYADSAHVFHLASELKHHFNTPQLRIFYSWQEFNSLDTRQK